MHPCLSTSLQGQMRKRERDYGKKNKLKKKGTWKRKKKTKK